jgi:hypothetical protein
MKTGRIHKRHIAGLSFLPVRAYAPSLSPQVKGRAGGGVAFALCIGAEALTARAEPAS